MVIKGGKSDFLTVAMVAQTNDNPTVVCTCFTVLDRKNFDEVLQNFIYRLTIRFLKNWKIFLRFFML